MGGSVFNMDGITFGLEICLDHAATPGNRNAGRLDNAANIQIQLIPSAGMQIGTLRTVTNGIVFNVDGSTPHVQIVGTPEGQALVGGPRSEIRYDLVSNNREWELEYPALVKFNNVVGVKSLVNNTELNNWTRLTSAPKIASGGSGSVLMYGPYSIPGT